MGGPGHRDRHLPTSFGLVMGQYPADGQGAHRRPVRGSSGGVGGLVAAAESLDRCRRGRAEASDGRLLLGQVRQESGRITVAVPVGQVMGDQQGQGRVVGGRTAWPSLAGGQLFDLAGSWRRVRAGGFSQGTPSASPQA